MSETPNTPDLGFCDTCGKPATNAAVDSVFYPNFATGHMDARPINPVKRGCDEHPVRAYDFHLETSPLLQEPS